jgi:hypothetical protein
MASSKITKAPTSAPQSSNSARLSVLQERVLREVEERMRLVTDDDDWKPPTQAAIDCGLHYTYIAHALVRGEMNVAIQAVSTPKGKTKMAVLNTAEVSEWLAEREAEAEAAGKDVLAEYLTDRYNIGRVLVSEAQDSIDGLPADLIPLEIAEQLLLGRGLPKELLDDAIVRGTVIIHRLSGEAMVSEESVVLISTSPNIGDGVSVEIEDSGECDHVQAAEKMGIDPARLFSAVESGECVGRRDGEMMLVRLSDVVQWYDTDYDVPDGQERTRFVLVNVNDQDGTNHYDTLIRCRFQVPNVSAIVNNISADVLAVAIQRGTTFGRGEVVAVVGVRDVMIDLDLTVGSLISLTYLASLSGHTPDAYMALLALAMAN